MKGRTWDLVVAWADEEITDDELEQNQFAFLALDAIEAEVSLGDGRHRSLLAAWLRGERLARAEDGRLVVAA